MALLHLVPLPHEYWGMAQSKEGLKQYIVNYLLTNHPEMKVVQVKNKIAYCVKR